MPAAVKAMDSHRYDIEKETAASRRMLEDRIPARLNLIEGALARNRQGFEPWRLALTVYLVESVRRNCGDLLEISRSGDNEAALPQMMPAQSNDPVDLMTQELLRGGPHRVYLRAVNSIRQLL